MEIALKLRKEFAPGSKCFPLRLARILEVILGIVFKIVPGYALN